MLRLEATGIDAHDIHLVTSPSVPTPEGERSADLKVATRFAWRYGVGAVLGALAGMALMFVALVAIGLEVGTAAVAAVFAGGAGAREVLRDAGANAVRGG